MTAIAIVDYGVGNLRSIEKAFAAVGSPATVSNDVEVLEQANALVLPGVGAFAACMRALCIHRFDELLVRRVKNGTPILGICVGMQLLFEHSGEFGHTLGLALLPGRVRRFDTHLAVPHVGWNQVVQRRKHPLLNAIEDQSFFYFVHSYFCEPAAADVIIGETDYSRNYASVVARDNICGVQFHPEKSQTRGLKLLSNFAQFSTSCSLV
ncbi:MAG TPA: imidazole glycerol phosphate synthase subunit HisH [Pyrinomonadaceae bacterium]|nr:imidazole glycerol phosphate synthase subunit HisH [Pyrinomonadaceae bacterium]